MQKDILRHELGHLFGAPNEQRQDIYAHLGMHCQTDLCVMQQKESMDIAKQYANLRARLNAGTYCEKCQQDIINFKPNSK